MEQASTQLATQLPTHSRDASTASEIEQTRLKLRCQQIRKQLKRVDEIYQQGRFSEDCFDVLQRSQRRELRATEEKLASFEPGDLWRYKEGLFFVLKSVAEGCNRKRPRVQ